METTTYTSDREFADKHDRQAINLLTQIFKELKNTNDVKIEIADTYSDTNEATDLIAYIDQIKYTIALRVRKPDCKFRDLTIRTEKTLKSSVTEIDKLINGYGDFYFYGWENNQNQIDDYILVDINKIRKLIKAKNNSNCWKTNYDGSKFLPISTWELDEYESLIKYKLKGGI